MKLKYAVIDFETTGLPLHRQAPLNKQPLAIEFAGIITDGEQIFDEIEFICNPGIDIEPIITKITGLQQSDLDDKPKFRAFIPKLQQFFTQSDAVIAHNLSFDKFIMVCDLMRNDMDLSHIDWPALEICTVEQTRPKFGYNMKLSALYELAIGPYSQKHRAMDDIMLLHEVCRHYGVYQAFNQLEV